MTQPPIGTHCLPREQRLWGVARRPQQGAWFPAPNRVRMDVLYRFPSRAAVSCGSMPEDPLPHSEPQSWKEFFDAHAPHYEKNAFTGWTSTEVSFLLKLWRLPAGSTVLDIGCGTGRHSVEFARRGYRVTGVDLSTGMLEQAKLAAEEAGVEVEWIQADATQFARENAFDAAICLCEGAFGLVNPNEEPVAHDLAILRNVCGSLKPRAPFVLTALNGYATIRRMGDAEVEKGIFDPATMVTAYVDEWDLPEGKRTMLLRERRFIAPELVAMLRHVGFEVEHVWGGTAGEWGKRPIKLDEIEAMYVCRKG
jgi:2-polyprenyl-3-methyl-5-hydroxy-6-metoxy-1,4-benzoquinol methylase